MFEQLARFKHNLHGRCHVCGVIRLYHRKEPALMLYPNGDAQIGTEPVFAGHPQVGQGPTVRNELRADFLVPEI